MHTSLGITSHRFVAALLCATVGLAPAGPAWALRTTQEGAGLEELRQMFQPSRLPSTTGLEEGTSGLHALEQWEVVAATFEPESRVFKALTRLYSVVRGAWVRELARGAVSPARWDHVVEVAALAALVSQRAEFPPSLRGVLVAAALLHDHPQRPPHDQLWAEDQLWESEVEGGFRWHLKQLLSAGRLKDHASARFLLDHWLAMVRATTPVLLPKALAGLPETEWPLPWTRKQAVQASTLLLQADQVATVITPGVDIAARLPTSWDHPRLPNNNYRGAPAPEPLAPDSPTALFAHLAPPVDDLFKLLVTDDDRSYRETWASRWASFVARFLRETPEAAHEILQKPNGEARTVFKARWEELQRAGVLVPRVQQAVASEPGTDDQLQPMTPKTREAVLRAGTRKLESTRERRLFVGPRHAEGLIVLDEGGHVWQAVSIAKDGQWQLMDLASPGTTRLVRPERLASQEPGQRYVVLTAPLANNGSRVGLEEGAAWLEPLRRAVQVWQAPGPKRDDQAKALLEVFGRAMATRAQSPGHSGTCQQF